MTLTRRLRMMLWGAGAAALLTVAAGAGAVYAQQQGYIGDDADEVEAIQRVKITLIGAIEIAERESSGKALSADIEVERGRTYYEIEVITPKGLQEIHIDADTGEVLRAARDWQVD